MDVTVCVGTFGTDEWWQQGHETAKRTAEAFSVPACHVHGETLHEARNEALAEVQTEWTCFLDADDELERRYFDHIETAQADIRVPSVRYVRNGFDQGERMPQVAGHHHNCTAKCLPWGNWIVIGAVARTEILKGVGGFRDFPWSEDWDLWVRCYQAGATIEPVHRAVYRAHVHQNSRNRCLSVDERIAAHNLIAEANSLPLVPA